MREFFYEVIHNFKRAGKDFFYMLKWFVIALLTGSFVGIVSVAFSWLDGRANSFRAENPWILYFLPIAGLLIIFLYHRAGVRKPGGTNKVISTLQADGSLPIRMSGLIFISTILTHLCGGSVGREGAALQLGGSLGACSKVIPEKWLDENDKRVIIMCGMSAAFSAIFGTPVAAAIFPMEVISIGIMQYSALFPCFISSLVASRFAFFLGFDSETIAILRTPTDTVKYPMMIVLMSVCVAVVSVLFVLMLKNSSKMFASVFKNQYIAIAVGGIAVVLLTLLLGTTDYNGAGMEVITRAVKGDVVWYAFIAKMIFTAISIGSGYKGGEIVPSFFIGATFGAWFASFTGIPTSIAAACGMAAMFCGVTNCPITSLLICCELFGFNDAAYFLLAIAVSYVMSGYMSLYATQRIMYSKIKTKFINKKVTDDYDDFD